MARIYEAAQHPGEWPSVLTDLSDHLGAIGGQVVRHGPSPDYCAQVIGRLDPVLSDLYLSRYTDNAYARSLARMPPGRPVLGNSLVDLAAVRRTAFHADILASQSIVEMPALVYAPWTQEPGFSGGISFPLASRAAAATDEIMRKLARLAPHLTRALDLSTLLSRNQMSWTTLEAALNAIPMAAALLGADGAVRRMNERGETLLRAGRGLQLRTRGRATTIEATHPADARAVARLIAETCATARGTGEVAGGRIRITSSSGDAPCILLLAPLPATPAPIFGLDEPTALLVISEVGSAPDPGILQEVFGLTPAEARLTSVVATGVGLPQAAASLGVGRETARTHLARSFEKMGVQSQVMLARLTATLPCGDIDRSRELGRGRRAGTASRNARNKPLS